MSPSDTSYHRVLRVSAVVCALTLVFQSGIVSEATQQMASDTQSYLANAVGASARVAPTELNQYTAELTARQRELDAREAAVRDREISLGLAEGEASPNTDVTTYILASILFILLVLIVLNYVLDYLRTEELKERQAV